MPINTQYDFYVRLSHSISLRHEIDVVELIYMIRFMLYVSLAGHNNIENIMREAMMYQNNSRCDCFTQCAIVTLHLTCLDSLIIQDFFCISNTFAHRLYI